VTHRESRGGFSCKGGRRTKNVRPGFGDSHNSKHYERRTPSELDTRRGIERSPKENPTQGELEKGMRKGKKKSVNISGVGVRVSKPEGFTHPLESTGQHPGPSLPQKRPRATEAAEKNFRREVWFWIAESEHGGAANGPAA